MYFLLGTYQNLIELWLKNEFNIPIKIRCKKIMYFSFLICLVFNCFSNRHVLSEFLIEEYKFSPISKKMNSLISNPGLSHIFTMVLNFLDTKNQFSCRLGEFTIFESQFNICFTIFQKWKYGMIMTLQVQYWNYSWLEENIKQVTNYIIII